MSSPPVPEWGSTWVRCEACGLHIRRGEACRWCNFDAAMSRVVRSVESWPTSPEIDLAIENKSKLVPGSKEWFDAGINFVMGGEDLGVTIPPGATDVTIGDPGAVGWWTTVECEEDDDARLE